MQNTDVQISSADGISENWPPVVHIKGRTSFQGHKMMMKMKKKKMMMMMMMMMMVKMIKMKKKETQSKMEKANRKEQIDKKQTRKQVWSGKATECKKSNSPRPPLFYPRPVHST